MLKWFLVVMVVVVLGGIASGQPSGRSRFRMGQLPGDLQLNWRGRSFRFPFTSTILMSLLVWLLLRAI